MNTDLIVQEFFDRIEAATDATIDGCTGKRCKAVGVVELDRQRAKAALDRLFADLRDFAGVIQVKGEAGGEIDPLFHKSKGMALREVIEETRKNNKNVGRKGKQK